MVSDFLPTPIAKLCACCNSNPSHSFHSKLIVSRLMHRALHICEILLEIFAHVNTTVRDRWSYHQPKFVRKSLAALAVTCKTFYEPAMNELWAVMFGLTLLLGCVTRLHPIIYCSDRKVSALYSFPFVHQLTEHLNTVLLVYSSKLSKHQTIIGE